MTAPKRPQFSVCKLVVESGTVIRMCSFFLTSTYDGLLAGFPGRRRNAELVGLAVERAQQLWRGVPVQLIEPHPVLYIPRQNPVPGPDGREYGYLPSFACAGRFQGEPANLDADHSELAIVWLQEEVPPLVDFDATEKIRRLRWAELVKDYSP